MTSSTQDKGKIMTAVVTGHHAHDVVAFQSAFRSMPELDVYPLNMEDFVTDTGNSRRRFDVVVFYNMHRPIPRGDQEGLESRIRNALESLGESEQGIFLLHHAILAYPGWDLWSEICGIQDRSFGIASNQTLRIQNASPEHPATRDLSSWEMEDETYIMADAGQGCEILLTTDHPKSMKTLAWSRQYTNARVLCYQSGHDNTSFSNPQFRRFVEQGIQWLARRT